MKTDAPRAATGVKNRIVVRLPETIYRAEGRVENGEFHGRWHFSFDRYDDPAHERFGTLRVFNDDTLSPGAVWPMHPHHEIEVVTYCAAGEFRHADENGEGGVLKKGWVQHTSVGRGMYHSEINNLPDRPMRFVQMWFIPSHFGREPAVQQRAVTRASRTDRLLPLVCRDDLEALPLFSDACVFSSFLQAGRRLDTTVKPGRGAYLYVVEGGPVHLNHNVVDEFGAAMVYGEQRIGIDARTDAELLLVDVARK